MHAQQIKLGADGLLIIQQPVKPAAQEAFRQKRFALLQKKSCFRLLVQLSDQPSHGAFQFFQSDGLVNIVACTHMKRVAKILCIRITADKYDADAGQKFTGFTGQLQTVHAVHAYICKQDVRLQFLDQKKRLITVGCICCNGNVHGFPVKKLTEPSAGLVFIINNQQTVHCSSAFPITLHLL